MKPFTFPVIFFLILPAITFSQPKDSHSNSAIEISGDRIKMQSQVVRRLMDSIVVKYRKTDKNMAALASDIGKDLKRCEKSIDEEAFYPGYLQSIYRNYEQILRSDHNPYHRDSVQALLHFMREDVSTRVIKGTAKTPFGSYYYFDPSPIEVEVRVKEPSTSRIIDGYTVSIRPFFVRDPSSIYKFSQLTSRAKEKIIPGWYVVQVKKGASIHEKDYILKLTAIKPVIIEVPTE